MAYDESLADRVREALAGIPNVEEKKMFRGMTFMVNDKMCISVSGDELMLRLDPEITEQLVEENGMRPMIHRGKHRIAPLSITEHRQTQRSGCEGTQSASADPKLPIFVSFPHSFVVAVAGVKHLAANGAGTDHEIHLGQLPGIEV